MFNDIDDQVPETNRQHVRLTQQLIGVVGEEEYFARQEAERERKLAEERQARLLAEEREKARSLHSMKCPKCGMQLEEIAFGEVRIDKCFSCEGLWLDKGELEVIQQKGGGFHDEDVEYISLRTQTGWMSLPVALRCVNPQSAP